MIDVEDAPVGSLRPARAAADRQMLRELTAAVDNQPSVRRRRRLLVGACVTALAVAGASTAAARGVLAPERAADRHSARCYAKVSRDTSRDFPGTTISIGASSAGPEPDVPPEAVAVCADLWRRGFLTPRGFRAPDSSGLDGTPLADQRVPHLVGCVLHNGQAAVFPGDASVCDRLGLPLLHER